MTTSGTYNFQPSSAELTLEAFSRCQIRGAALDRDMMIEARRSLNMMQIEYQNRPGWNLWTVDGPVTLPLVAGQNLYVLGNIIGDNATVAILDCWYTIINGYGPGQNLDRWMVPMSETDYAMIPQKLMPGQPTRYWYQKLREPLQQLYIWQVPTVGQDTAANYAELNFYRVRRIQDADYADGTQMDATIRALNAVCWDLAIVLAGKYKPELVAQPGNFLERMAAQSWKLFADKDRDDSDISVTPSLYGYYRS